MFCPTCSNLLLVEDGSSGVQLFCQTCPYVYVVKTVVCFLFALAVPSRRAFRFTAAVGMNANVDGKEVEVETKEGRRRPRERLGRRGTD